MQTTFKNKSGATFAPSHFAVYHIKGGNTFKKVQHELHTYDFSNYDDVVKIELYENGTANLSPVQVDAIYNK